MTKLTTGGWTKLKRSLKNLASSRNMNRFRENKNKEANKLAGQALNGTFIHSHVKLERPEKFIYGKNFFVYTGLAER
ncbi:hypothetical protein BpJC7_28880 [Weizmannia acidilactici]|uniref:Uncharacterized protein n=1 Tax=Weizmannia acidilactici TaxID=2607726 RepID=A0A5J4JLK6_9BACI|nr:hypothetical protein BpJC7_28880 [Weizmannia acidilactici]